MRPALSLLPRLAFGCLVMATLAALGLARLAPSSSPGRSPSPARHILINHQPGWLRPAGRDLFWMDAETGRTTRVPLRGGPMLQAASLSPWLDERGRPQVAGFRGQGINEGGIVLERASFPDGAVLDAIDIDVVPGGSRVCWYPGTRARVLFAGSDKRLYQFAFEGQAPEGRVGPAEGPMDRPRALAWHCADPTNDEAWFDEPHWPADPRFARLIVARFSEIDRPGRRGGSGVAWLRLGEAGDSVEEWGRLLDTSALPPGTRARAPSVGVAPDGRLLLAYFDGSAPGPSRLLVAPLALGADGRPPSLARPGRVVAEGCLGDVPAAFSRDGRFVSVVDAGGGATPVVRRIDLDPCWRALPGQKTLK